MLRIMESSVASSRLSAKTGCLNTSPLPLSCIVNEQQHMQSSSTRKPRWQFCSMVSSPNSIRLSARTTHAHSLLHAVCCMLRQACAIAQDVKLTDQEATPAVLRSMGSSVDSSRLRAKTGCPRTTSSPKLTMYFGSSLHSRPKRSACGWHRLYSLHSHAQLRPGECSADPARTPESGETRRERSSVQRAWPGQTAQRLGQAVALHTSRCLSLRREYLESSLHSRPKRSACGWHRLYNLHTLARLRQGQCSPRRPACTSGSGRTRHGCLSVQLASPASCSAFETGCIPARKRVCEVGREYLTLTPEMLCMQLAQAVQPAHKAGG